MPNFDKILITCPVKRLGSLMDFSPAIDRALDHFGRRCVIVASPEAASLYRHRFDTARQNGSTIIVDDLSEKYSENRDYLLGSFQLAWKDRQIAGFSLYDDPRTLDHSCELFDYLTPPGTIKVGDVIQETTNFNRREQIDIEEVPEIPDGVRRSRPFDHIADANLCGAPFVLNSALLLEKTIFELDNNDNPSVPIPQNERPVIWTTELERSAAAAFFEERGVDASRTIGFHFTAGTYNVFQYIWPRESFMSVAKHFAASGCNILAACGYILATDGFESTASVAVHQCFLDELGGNSHLFFGDVLVQAEIIRMCAAFISPETDPAHLASAVGTQKVTIAASHDQAFTWMLTGENDFGMVAEFGTDPGTVYPTVKCVINGLEQILSR